MGGVAMIDANRSTVVSVPTMRSTLKASVAGSAYRSNSAFAASGLAVLVPAVEKEDAAAGRGGQRFGQQLRLPVTGPCGQPASRQAGAHPVRISGDLATRR